MPPGEFQALNSAERFEDLVVGSCNEPPGAPSKEERQMDIGSSMLARRVHQEENDPLAPARGLLIGGAIAVVFWILVALLWLL